MHAVILTGGKQYRVKPGDLLSVEKIGVENGHKFDFGQVLLIEDGENVLIGTPALAGALVRAEVVETYKDEKVLVFKKKRRKQFRRTRGHRQQLTKVRIEGIFPDGSLAPAVEAPVEKPEPAAREKAAEPKPRPQAQAPAAAAPAPKKPAKAKKPAKDARAKAAPKAKTVGKKTAGAKPKKASKE
jgi:large subunit ribosomal protein L21